MRFLSAAALLLIGCVSATGASAQGVLSGQLGGVVFAADGRPVANALVTLSAEGSGLTRETSTSLGGEFSFQLVPSGRYTLRAEALGYRPLVVTGVAVEVGGYREVELALQAAAPPITEVDTLRFQSSEARWTAHGPRALDGELAALTDVSGTLSAVTRLSPDLDRQQGALGLPGGLTQPVIDGVPFYRAHHPGRRGDDLGSPAFPTAFLNSASLARRADDIEFLMAPGALIDGQTRTVPRGGAGVNVEGAWSGGPLWSSGTIDVESPTLSSFRAFAEGAVDLVPDTSHLYLAAEALTWEAPLQPRLGADFGDALSAFGDEIAGLLLMPSTERISRYSGLARLDRQGAASRLTIRASGGRLERSYDGAPPGWLHYTTAVPEETTEVSTAAAYATEVGARYVLEFLAGVSVSDRRFGWADETPWTPAHLSETGIPIGPAAGSFAEASRLDAFTSTSLQVPLGPGDLRGGLSFHAGRHTLRNGYAAGGDLSFSDLAAAAVGVGQFRSGTPTETSFFLPRIGVFAQYTWRPTTDVQILLGARFDRMNLSTDELRLNEEWLAATGGRSDDFPTTFNLPAGHVSASWDVTGSGETVFTAGGSIAHGSLDPALVHEAFSNDGAATVQRAVGTGIAWPAGDPPSGARRAEVLTLLGPDTRPMRTVTLEGALRQSLGPGWSLHVSAIARNTDFIARRRDLNLPVFPAATDLQGRDVLGDLRKERAVVGARPGSNRRFQGLDAVWAMDPDGWSRYWGATVGLAYTTATTALYTAYTRSETRDNWVGAAAGLPDAELNPGLPGVVGEEWAEGLSDFDSPHRLVVGARAEVDLGGTAAEFSAVYTRRSGLPFTPRYRVGVDANGDGSFRNDVAFVPGGDELGALLGEWSCLSDQIGGFAERNSCRGPDLTSFDASARLGVATVGDRRLWLTVEGFNLIEGDGGIVDEALLLVDPDAPLNRNESTGQVSIPVSVNPEFGQVVFPATRGRMLRLGLRIGGTP